MECTILDTISRSVSRFHSMTISAIRSRKLDVLASSCSSWFAGESKLQRAEILTDMHINWLQKVAPQWYDRREKVTLTSCTELLVLVVHTSSFILSVLFLSKMHPSTTTTTTVIRVTKILTQSLDGDHSTNTFQTRTLKRE